MQIKITLTDHESGNVHIETSPEITKLLEIAKTTPFSMTPAETYAMVALRRLIEFSGEVAKQRLGVQGAAGRTRLIQ